ncbi:MAG: RNA methyltransferase [Planctomycetota bacterium]|nr:RNA methyltransferase [Planctomycetota bacterium]
MEPRRAQARNVFELIDLADPRLANYRDIRDRGLLGRDGIPGLFVGEQPLIVQRMLSMPGVTKSVLVVRTWADRIAPLAPPEVPVYVAPLDLMRHVAGFTVHRGVLAVGYRSAIERSDLASALRPAAPLTVLLCENITNIDNIGLLFRNAAAFGVDAVVLSPRCHDPLYRKSLRVSIGHALTVPFVRCLDWPGDLVRLKARWNLTLIAAALDERAIDLRLVDRPERVGLVVGEEFHGLSPTTLDHCDHIVKVPMAPGVDSLNVAVAAAVCLHRFSTGKRI